MIRVLKYEIDKIGELKSLGVLSMSRISEGYTIVQCCEPFYMSIRLTRMVEIIIYNEDVHDISELKGKLFIRFIVAKYINRGLPVI